MKHVFYVCPNVSESLGLEKVLQFYNVISVENSEAVEDFINEGHNVIVADDFSSSKLKEFIENFSYNEKPLVLSAIQNATIKFSQLYDWDIRGSKPTDININADNDSLVFSVYKNGNKKIFGNIHRFFVKEFNQNIIEIFDWSKDFINQVKELTEKLDSLPEGYSTVECKVNSDDSITLKSNTTQSLPAGIGVFTRAQILDNQSPFILYEIIDDVEKEDKLTFTEDFNIKNPESQNKPYNITSINIKSKYETVIKNNFAGGIWKYGGDNTGKTEKICISIYEIDEEGDKTLCLLHRGYSLYDIEGQEGIAINTKEKDSKLKAGDTIASLRIPASVLDNKNELFGWVNEVIGAILTVQMK